jgi:hypothetical protein
LTILAGPEAERRARDYIAARAGPPRPPTHCAHMAVWSRLVGKIGAAGSDMPYNGYLDWNDGWAAFGWAFDSDRPDEPVEVEFRIGMQYLGALKADEFRPDLRQFGTGRHAFSFRFPPQANIAGNLTAQIKNTGFVLKGSPMALKQRESIGLIAGDIVNQCNLRCPFCIVDYTNFGNLKLMTRETFDRAIQLLPMTPPGNFWLSCLHEPTMHPRFVDFIEAVRDEYRDRISFTTNLSKRMPEDILERLANSGVHTIRVSFDSRRPDIFAELRKKGKYQVFEQNLLALTKALISSKRRPQLRFITMAFKDNYREIADLVRFGRDLGADSHEIRYIYYVPHLARWGKDHIMSASEWVEMERLLSPLARPSLEVCGPIRDTLAQFEDERGLAQYVARENFFGGDDNPSMMTPPDALVVGRALPDEALRLRLRWDGVMVSEQVPEETFRANINQIERPAEYFDFLRLTAARGRNLAIA